MSECIYKFVERPRPKEPKKQIYRSKYDPDGPLIGSTFGMQGTTAVDGKGFTALKKNHVVNTSFGVQPRPPDPKKFLRRGSRRCKERARIPSVERPDRDRESHKPSVPSRADKPVQGLRTSEDYVNRNAVEAINSVAINSVERRRSVAGEGVPSRVAREDYGRVPAYLGAVKAEIDREREMVDEYVEEQYGPVGGRDGCQEHEVMDERERGELICNLKQRWGCVNADYQKYCHKVNFDTPGERKRKASQEAELKQLEEYIEKLSCPGPLVINK